MLSQLLRGFDQGSVEVLQENMKKFGVDILEGAMISKIIPDPAGSGYLVAITLASDKSRQPQERHELISAHFDTVIAAVSRKPETQLLNLKHVGVNIDPSSGKVMAELWTGEPDGTPYGPQNSQDIT